MSKRIIRRFPMPAGCDAKTVSVATLVKSDELGAAIAADAYLRSGQVPAGSANSAMVALEVQRTENVRASLVKIDGRRVNVDGVPCLEIDGWSQKSWAALYSFYGEMNGIPGDELGNCVKAGVDEPDESDGPAPSQPVASAGR